MVAALDGIRVLDLSSVIMGPLTGQLLGDMGADVIKIEGPEGDTTRNLGPKRHEGMAAVYLNLNRNKRSLVLDLKKADGRTALRHLISSCDVLLHSNRTAAAKRLGITYSDVHALNPRLIYCQVRGFSDEGIYAGLSAYDDIVQALSGLAMLQTAVSSGEPRYIPTTLIDKVCGMEAAYAISLALFHRERTGAGQEIGISMFETMAAFNTFEHLWGYVFEPPIGAMGYGSIRAGSRRPYKTSDGYLAFLPYTDEHWRRFFEKVGDAETGKDPRFANLGARMQNHDVVFGYLRNKLLERTNIEWLALFERADIPMAAVNRLEDLISDPHLQSINFWKLVDHPTEGKLRAAGMQFSMSATQPEIRRLAPNLGEHTTEILKEFGYGPQQISRLLEDNIALQYRPPGAYDHQETKAVEN